jgi:hypothetical protein
MNGSKYQILRSSFCQVAANALPDLQNPRAIPAAPESKKTAEAVFLHKRVKLTVKPLSFRYSVVDSHSSSLLITCTRKQKPRHF